MKKALLNLLLLTIWNNSELIVTIDNQAPTNDYNPEDYEDPMNALQQIMLFINRNQTTGLFFYITSKYSYKQIKDGLDLVLKNNDSDDIINNVDRYQSRLNRLYQQDPDLFVPEESANTEPEDEPELED